MIVRRIVLALLAAVVLLSGCAAPAAQQALPAIENYTRPELLVDTAWLKARLADPTVRLLDLSSKPEVFAAGWIPGAVYVNPRTDITNPDEPVEGVIFSAEQFAALFSRLGIRPSDTVVIYDDSSNLYAARAFWTFKYYQHADVRMLNGGVKRWQADGEALTTEVATYVPVTYTPGAPDPSLVTTWQDVVASLDEPNTVFCDTRSLAEYTGIDARAARGGNIPDSIHVEWKQAVNGDGTFKSAGELLALYTKAGFTPDKDIITYCQTGVRSAHTWFVLTQLLGYPSVRNYDGSWTEYGNNPASVIN
jgi:thiosulfate/3-mercaptopyruvate sulfurtransferase